MSEATPAPDRAEQRRDDRERRDELVRGIVAGELGFHQLPDELGVQEQAEVRRQALERLTRTRLDHVGRYSLDADRAGRQNCENFVGAAQLPMGIVGPIRLHGEQVEGDVFAPLATTEAALVASTNRGCAAIRAAGGATVHVEDVGMTRAPAFRTSGLRETRQFLEWVEENEEAMREVAEATSRFLKLLDVRSYSFGTTVLLRFRFDTGDAMGMNMATIACDRMVRELIEPVTGVECVALSGNFCVDKKPAAVNWQEGRGKRIRAEIVLDGPVLKRYLKTTPQQLEEVQYRKNLLGSIAAGSQGYNAHYANMVSAFFIATGQDPAHVVGASVGVTCIERREPDHIYVSVYLPDVPLAAIGGGTNLETQREALSILGVKADSNSPGKAVHRLGEILGGVVLAGELSLMAAFTSKDLAGAHERLGRGHGT